KGRDDRPSVVTSGCEGFEEVSVFAVAVTVPLGPPPGAAFIGAVGAFGAVAEAGMSVVAAPGVGVTLGALSGAVILGLGVTSAAVDAPATRAGAGGAAACI